MCDLRMSWRQSVSFIVTNFRTFRDSLVDWLGILVVWFDTWSSLEPWIPGLLWSFLRRAAHMFVRVLLYTISNPISLSKTWSFSLMQYTIDVSCLKIRENHQNARVMIPIPATYRSKRRRDLPCQNIVFFFALEYLNWFRYCHSCYFSCASSNNPLQEIKDNLREFILCVRYEFFLFVAFEER